MINQVYFQWSLVDFTSCNTFADCILGVTFGDPFEVILGVTVLGLASCSNRGVMTDLVIPVFTLDMDEVGVSEVFPADCKKNVNEKNNWKNCIVSTQSILLHP